MQSGMFQYKHNNITKILKAMITTVTSQHEIYNCRNHSKNHYTKFRQNATDSTKNLAEHYLRI